MARRPELGLDLLVGVAWLVREWSSGPLNLGLVALRLLVCTRERQMRERSG